MWASGPQLANCEGSGAAAVMGASQQHSRSSSWLDSRGTIALALSIVQLGYAGYFILSKAALSNGANRFVFAVYRDIIGLLFLAPFAYLSERGQRTPLTPRVVVMLVISGLTGVFLFQALSLTGLKYTSPAFASAMQNSIPVSTFIIGVLSRVEVIHYARRDGQAQLLGVLGCVAGATVMTLYRGPILFSTKPHSTPPTESLLVGNQSSVLVQLPLGLEIQSWTFGSMCLLLNSVCMGIYVNLQRPILRRYPAPISLTALAYAIGAIFLVISGLFFVEKRSDWVITETTALIAVGYAGVINSAVNFSIQTWCCHKSGPILVTVFAPLQTVFATLLALAFLGDTYYLGSVIGSILVMLGLYLVIWGQAEDRRLASQSIKIQPISDGQVVIKPLTSFKEPLLG